MSMATITIRETCDGCGVRSQFAVTLSNGSHLAFCAHHLHAAERQLRAAHAEIVDLDESSR